MSTLALFEISTVSSDLIRAHAVSYQTSSTKGTRKCFQIKVTKMQCGILLYRKEVTDRSMLRMRNE